MMTLTFTHNNTVINEFLVSNLSRKVVSHITFKGFDKKRTGYFRYE